MDLKSIYPTIRNPDTTASESTTVLFAASVEGNIGAGLDDSWVTGRQVAREGVRYSDDPLSVGLLDIQDNQGQPEGL